MREKVLEEGSLGNRMSIIQVEIERIIGQSWVTLKAIESGVELVEKWVLKVDVCLLGNILIIIVLKRGNIEN